MPFYKVPSPNSTSLPDTKRVRAPLRHSQASSPDPPDESKTIGNSESIQNFGGGFSDHRGAYVNGRGGTGGGGGAGDWTEAADSNPAHWHPTAAGDMNGTRYQVDPPPDQQVSIVELEIQQQSEREAELIALRQSLYQQQQQQQQEAFSQSTVTQSTVTSDRRINRTSTGPRPSSGAPSVTGQRALSPPHLSSGIQSTVSSSAVTYEEAISTRAHPGESLIAREIMELKMREEELKRNRNGLGRVLPPESAFGDVHSTHVVHSVPSPSESSFSSSSASSSVSVGAHPKPDAVDGDGRSRSRAPRIRPLGEPQPDAVKFHPQMETPIDREVRLSREREDALRQARGLPAVSTVDGEAMVVEMRLPDGTIGGTSSASGADRKSDQTMKKLASSRLMVEIEKEKQRELEVRRHNQHPHHHGNASSAAAASAGQHQGNNAKSSNSYMRKY